MGEESHKGISTPIVVAIGFAVFIAAGLFIGYLLSQAPSPEEACRTRCAEIKRSGRLVYEYPPEQTAGMRGKGPTNCECY